MTGKDRPDESFEELSDEAAAAAGAGHVRAPTFIVEEEQGADALAVLSGDGIEGDDPDAGVDPEEEEDAPRIIEADEASEDGVVDPVAGEDGEAAPPVDLLDDILGSLGPMPVMGEAVGAPANEAVSDEEARTAFRDPEYVSPTNISTSIYGSAVNIWIARQREAADFSEANAVQSAVNLFVIAYEPSSILSFFDRATEHAKLPSNVLVEARKRVIEDERAQKAQGGGV